MDCLINLLAVVPNGLWEKLIIVFNNAFGNFALSIIILTICIKLVMLPLDFCNKYFGDKNARQQAILKPEEEKIKAKYTQSKAMLRATPERQRQIKQQESMEIQKMYKQKGFNPMGSCLVTLLNLALTLTVFITLINGLNAMASYKIQDQYEQLQIAYVSQYVDDNYDFTIYDKLEENNAKSDDDETKQSIYEIVSPYVAEITEEADIAVANKNVENKYKEVKESFLWIDNIWIADTPFTSSIPTFDGYANVAMLDKESKENTDLKNTYNKIMEPLKETSGRANGFFILSILTGATAFLNQWLISRRQKKLSKKAFEEQQRKRNDVMPQMATAGKTMMIVMPILLTLFSLMYTSLFSIYLVTSQLIVIATTPLINLINEKISKRQKNKKNDIVPKNPRRV